MMKSIIKKRNFSRPSQNLCKPLIWCRIEALYWRLSYEQQKKTQSGGTSPERMLMYGKEASNRKQEIDRQHYTIPNQRPKDKHCGKI